jgi:hypothetical protein
MMENEILNSSFSKGGKIDRAKLDRILEGDENLINYTNEDGQTLLLQCLLSQENADDVIYLINEKNAEIVIKDRYQNCPIILILQRREEFKDLKMVIPFNDKTKKMVTTFKPCLLRIACEYGNYEGVKYLLSCGSDPDESDEFGQTPLHILAEYQSTRSNYEPAALEAFEVLIESVAECPRNSMGQTFMDKLQSDTTNESTKELVNRLKSKYPDKFLG